jgi:hypothetical protein
LSQKALDKKKCLKLGIIACCILIPFLFSYAENNDKVAENGAVPVDKSNPQSVSATPDISRDVKQIQTLLALLKFNPGPIDGILGKKTTTAIIAFQSDIGVPATGKIDENLKSQLDRAYRLVVMRTKEQSRDDEAKREIIKEKQPITASQDIKPFSMPEELETRKEPEVKQQKEIETGPQKEHTSNGHDLKTENQYLKYIKISFPVVAVIFLAYFYRIWTRSHEKKRDGKRPQKADFEAERSQKAKPEEGYEEPLEVQELETGMTDDADGKSGIDQQDPIDYPNPLLPGYITPVVRRKVWIRNKGQCAACGNRKELQYDYIVPILEGGHNTLDNLQLLCKICSQEKSVK